MTMILPHIEKMPGYVEGVMPSAGTKAIRLNLNESPYPPSPHVQSALQEIGEEVLRRYPDSRCEQLRAELAANYGVKAEQTFCANGSSEIISLIMKVFVGPEGKIALPDPSFPLYHSVAAGYQAKCIAVPTREDFSIDVDKLRETGAQAVVVVNPNAPTGLMLAKTELIRLLESMDGLVIVDEAYMDFADSDESVISLVDQYPNLLVLRTFSKSYGLCGVRVGYGFADERLITALEKAKDVYNVDAIARHLALAALRDQSYMKETTGRIKRTRAVFSKQLESLGFSVIPSQTNFILCQPPAKAEGQSARELYEKLMEQGIYVRYYQLPRLADMLRITVGTEAEMEEVYAALSRMIE